MVAGVADVGALVREHAVDNTVIVTFSNNRQQHITLNWIYHWQQLRVGGLLVGMMNMKETQPAYRALATKLRALSVGVYTVNGREVLAQPQGGRWFHVLPLLQTGVRVLLSDSDAVWLRNPLPYFRLLEERHPSLDFAVSSDAQFGTDGRLLGAAAEGGGRQGGGRGGRGRWRRGRGGGRRLAEAAAAGAAGAAGAAEEEPAHDLDIEASASCWESMNIGIVYFPPGARPGALRLLREATAHLSENNNLRRVDQGPLNFRWKHGTGKWRWREQLHGVRDATGKRLCALVNGTVRGGVLPAAQFCNTLTHDVLQLWRARAVRPYVLHATWMRQQAEAFKLMRLREARLWRDAPAWYMPPPAAAWGAAPRASRSPAGLGHLLQRPAAEPAVGFVTMRLTVPPELLRVPRIARGALPLHHLRLMRHQLQQLRNGLFVARLLGRALVLPEARCSCELGFWPNHIEEHCRAARHDTVPLPYACPIDHYLAPIKLASSAFLHRERSFLRNPRTPAAVLANSTAAVRFCADAAACAAAPSRPNEVVLPSRPSAARLRAALGPLQQRWKVLHLDDAALALGSFDDGVEAAAWHSDAQALLSAWCCTSDPRFKRTAGEVPYLLPPLEGQTHWRGEPRLSWVAGALAYSFEAAGDRAMAIDVHRNAQPS